MFRRILILLVGVSLALGASTTAAFANGNGNGKGGSAEISVEFSCTSVEVTSSTDISNVVIEFADGSTQKFDGLSDTSWSFEGSKVIATVWVKSGANNSGDGPGYGEGFDSDAECATSVGGEDEAKEEEDDDESLPEDDDEDDSSHDSDDSANDDESTGHEDADDESLDDDTVADDETLDDDTVADVGSEEESVTPDNGDEVSEVAGADLELASNEVQVLGATFNRAAVGGVSTLPVTGIELIHTLFLAISLIGAGIGIRRWDVNKRTVI